MVVPASRRRLRTLAAGAAGALGAAALAWTIAVLITGGLTLRIGGQRISSTDPWRPAAAGIVLLGTAVAIEGWRRSRERAALAARAMTPGAVVAAVAVITAAVGLAYGTWTASGPDSFAYVSQASLWRNGVPALDVPLAAEAPWPAPVRTFMPFGYRPATSGPALVPVTSPGLPLMMMAARATAGYPAMFVITPLAGAACVWLTFLIGRRWHSPRTGLIAALLVASNPVFLFMLMWPMTDVPAAAAVALIVWLLLRGDDARTTNALGAGFAAAFAILLRPNMLFIAVAAGAWLMLDALVWRRGTRAWTRVLLYACGAVPGLAVTLRLNAVWYGSPFASGYGSAGSLFSIARLGTNAGRYGAWLAASSPLLAAGVAAIVWLFVRSTTPSSNRRSISLVLLIVIANAGLYLVYEPYDAWWYLRFLLPIFPLLAVASALALDSIAARGRVHTLAAAVVVALGVVHGAVYASTHGVFRIRDQERRFATVASLVAQQTDADAVVLTLHHSGTIRYYAGRETLRWDELDPAWLDRAIAWLASRGRHPYILLEDTERAAFERRFAGPADQPRLPTFAAVLAWQSTRVPGWVWLYDPLRRDAVTATAGPEYEAAQPWCSPPARGW